MTATLQPTAVHISHDIAKYALKTYLPIKLGIDAIYAKYLIDL